MHGVDRRLQLVRPGLIALEAPAHDRVPFIDFRAIPARAVLLSKQHQRSVWCDARRASHQTDRWCCLLSRTARAGIARKSMKGTRSCAGASSAINPRSEEHTSELQSHSFISYAVFCLK